MPRSLKLTAAVLLLAAVAAGLYVAFSPGSDGGANRDSGGDASHLSPNAAPLADVTAAAGIAFRHESGARGEKLNPETFGPGASWFDHDGDGRIDLLLVNGNLLRGTPDPTKISALYRNLGDGRFEDVTARAGLDVPFYGMGAATADIDNDGDQDLLLYGLRRSYFFLNDGSGRFRDATSSSGLTALQGWVCAAAFLDYDLDGRLDLFVGNYVDWKPELEEGVDCTFGGPGKKYCPVAMFPPSAPQLFRGLGDGRFEEVTVAAGLAALQGKALGIAVEDYNRDDYPDIFVANDTVPNFLLENRGDGTFVDRGIESGFATDADGAALAGMGIDTAWGPDDGPLMVAVGNFSGEPLTLHVQEGRDFFIERSLATAVGRNTVDSVTFGLSLHDHDLDGELDLAVANGHVFDVEASTSIPYRQRTQLFLGRGETSFAELRPADSAHFLNRRIIGRALAVADYDADGDLDLVVTENQGAAVLLRNDLEATTRRVVRIDLRGRESNRDAIGAEVTLRTRLDGRDRSVRRTRKAASSYLAQNERQITFALRPGEQVVEIEVKWPSRHREVFREIEVGTETLLVEGAGAASQRQLVERVEPIEPVETPAGASSLALRQQGVALLEQGRADEALGRLRSAVDIDPHDFVAQRFLLVALWRLGRRQELERQVRAVSDLFDSAGLLVSHFAIVLRETGHRPLAALLYEEAGRLDPGRADIWRSLGNLAFDAGEPERAIEYYARVLELNPQSVEALTNTGKSHAVLKQFEDAERFLERARTLRPDYATVLSTLGGVFIQSGRFEEAESYLRRALETATDDETRMTVHGNLGILYFKRRDRQRAIEAFEKVLDYDPNDRQALGALERLRR